MARTDFNTLKERILLAYDADYILDVLRITAEELVDAFEDKVLLMANEFDELEDDDEIR